MPSMIRTAIKPALALTLAIPAALVAVLPLAASGVHGGILSLSILFGAAALAWFAADRGAFSKRAFKTLVGASLILLSGIFVVAGLGLAPHSHPAPMPTRIADFVAALLPFCAGILVASLEDEKRTRFIAKAGIAVGAAALIAAPFL